MYARSQTWLPPSPFRFQDLQRLASRSRAGLAGLGDVSCGVSPCGFFDNIWASDACLAWRACNAQNAPLLNAIAPNPPAPNLGPVLQAMVPGVPVGYDWNTGQIDPSNTTGAIPPPDPAAVAAGWGQVRASLPGPTVPAWTWIALGLVGVGLFSYFGKGGRG